MSRIRIKDFGPVHKGLVENDGWINVKKVTVFTGNQGSGKSTVAKLISIFSWLEKGIIRNDISIEQLNTTVFKNLCIRQELVEYFHPNKTHIDYEGDACRFEYDDKENVFHGTVTNKLGKYILPKIQYVSSARNLLTILYSISQQNITDNEGNVINMAYNIPFMVRELNKEYLMALTELAKDGFPLPIDSTSVHFQNHNTFIKTRGTRISMAAASSGVQSITPLLLVSSYLSKQVQKDLSERIGNIDSNLKNRIESELNKEDKALSEKFRSYCSYGKTILKDDGLLPVLEERIKRFIPASFTNIVEEPEQNLFPTSQRSVLYSLLEINNTIPSNKLILTTHSPYIIRYLTLAIKAHELYGKSNLKKQKDKIDEIVPFQSAVDEQDVVIYELDEKNGTIKKLDTLHGLPSDDNDLNNELDVTNLLFDKLLEIEDLCQ